MKSGESKLNRDNWLGRIKLLSLWLLMALLIAVVLLALIGPAQSYENTELSATLNIIFLGLISWIMAWIMARSFIRSSQLHLLFIGMVQLLVGTSSSIGPLFLQPTSPNAAVTVHNVSILLAGLLLVGSAALAWRSRPAEINRATRLLLVILCYTTALVLVVLLAWAAMSGWMPPFVLQHGFSTTREVVIGLGTFLFFIGSATYGAIYLKSRSDFIYWYSLCLGSFSIGLLGILLQPAVGSILGWTGRGGQFLSGVYLIIAALVALKEAKAKGIGIQDLIAEFSKQAQVNYELLVNTASDAIIAVDELGRILMWNPAAEKMFGYSQSEAIGSPFFDLIISLEHVASYKKAADTVALERDNPEPAVAMELKARKRNGEEFPAELMLASRKLAAERFPTTVLILRNITERKRAVEALRESEERYRSVITDMSEGLMIFDEKGNVTFQNPASLRIHSFEPQEEERIQHENLPVEWKGWDEAGRPLPFEEWPIARVALRHEHVQNQVLHALRIDTGHEFDASYNGAPVYDAQGRFAFGFITIQDITERKRAEEALCESEQKFMKVFQGNAAAIALTRLHDRHVIEVNEKWQEVFGFSREEVIDRPANKIKLWKHPEEQMQAIHDLETHGAVRNREGEFLRKNGEVWIGLMSSEIIQLQGEGFILTSLVDITERKRAEEALSKAHDELELRVQERTAELGEKNVKLEAEINERKQAEEKIREQATLLDNAQEAIGVRSLEHNLIYWNKGAERLYGFSAQEAIGKNPIEFLFKDKEEPPQLIEAKRIVLEKGEWTGELHQVTKDGKEVIVESHWTLIYDSEGKPKSILVVNTDITEKKMFETHLLRAQRMESIGILAGGIAHNLNNMLTPMMMSLHMLKQKYTDEQSQKLLTILEKNSERSADLIKQVLSFSRGVEGERNSLHVANIVFEVEKIAKETFPRNIEIRTDIPKDLFTISGDATQLHQVIMNLCVNARDAMPDGGILSISAQNFFIDDNYSRMHTEAKVGSYVVIAVSDTGIGIPPKIVDRIFEPFFTTKEFGKGTGLGLSTALAIVKSHGGFINVYSEIGKGTMFRVYLLATLAEMQNVEEQKLELLTGQGELVLVAEDEDSVREVTVSTL